MNDDDDDDDDDNDDNEDDDDEKHKAYLPSRHICLEHSYILQISYAVPGRGRKDTQTHT